MKPVVVFYRLRYRDSVAWYMGQDASKRAGANETPSAKDKKFVHLPNTNAWWKDFFKGFLADVQAVKFLTLDHFAASFAENDPFKEVKELTNLKKTCTVSINSPVKEKELMEELLPWLAGKALAVEELFVEDGRHDLLKVNLSVLY